MNVSFEIGEEKFVSIEREQILLRTIINNPFCFYDVSEKVSVADFFYGQNKVVWETLGRMMAKNIPIDHETMKNAIIGTEEENYFPDGVAEYFELGVVGQPAVQFESRKEVLPLLREQLKILKQLTLRRQARDVALKILSDINSQLVLDDFKPAIEHYAEMLHIIATGVGMKSIESDPAFGELWRYMDYVRSGASEYVPSGIVDIDTEIGGFRRGWEYLIGALTNKGKTALMTSILERQIGTVRFAVFSLEQEFREIGCRILAKRLHLEGSAILSPQITPYDKDRIEIAINELRVRNSWFCDDRELTLEELRSEARAIKARSGLDIVFVDYFQELDVKKPRGEYPLSEEQKVARKVKSLRAMAKELNVAVVVFTQYTKQAVDGMKPLLDWLPYSSALQQTPDMILNLWTPLDENGFVKTHLLDVKKNRAGAKDFAIELNFEKKIPAFYSKRGRDE